MSEITVRPGDTLSSLALRHLGRADRWPDLWLRNAAAIAKAQRPGARRHAGMAGPNWIFPGTVLIVDLQETHHADR